MSRSRSSTLQPPQPRHSGRSLSPGGMTERSAVTNSSPRNKRSQWWDSVVGSNESRVPTAFDLNNTDKDRPEDFTQNSLQFVRMHAARTRYDLPTEKFFTGTEVVSRIQDVSIRCMTTVGERVWVGEKDGTLSVFDFKTGNLLHRGPRKKDMFVSSILEVGVHVWVGYNDGMVRIFDRESMEVLKEVREHAEGGTIHAMLSAYNNRCVYTASGDFIVTQWDAVTCERVSIFRGHKGGVRCLTMVGQRLFTAGDDKTIKSWDVFTGECLDTYEGHTGSVRALCGTGSQLWSSSEDNTIRIWDVFTGECIHVICEGHTGHINHLALVGSKMWSCSYSTVFIWDVQTFELQGQFQKHDGWITDMLVVHQSVVSRVWTASADGTVNMWNSESLWSGALKAASDQRMLEIEYQAEQSDMRGNEYARRIAQLEEEVSKHRSGRTRLLKDLDDAKNDAHKSKVELLRLKEELDGYRKKGGAPASDKDKPNGSGERRGSLRTNVIVDPTEQRLTRLVQFAVRDPASSVGQQAAKDLITYMARINATGANGPTSGHVSGMSNLDFSNLNNNKSADNVAQLGDFGAPTITVTDPSFRAQYENVVAERDRLIGELNAIRRELAAFDADKFVRGEDKVVNGEEMTDQDRATIQRIHSKYTDKVLSPRSAPLVVKGFAGVPSLSAMSDEDARAISDIKRKYRNGNVQCDFQSTSGLVYVDNDPSVMGNLGLDEISKDDRKALEAIANDFKQRGSTESYSRSTSQTTSTGQHTALVPMAMSAARNTVMLPALASLNDEQRESVNAILQKYRPEGVSLRLRPAGPSYTSIGAMGTPRVTDEAPPEGSQPAAAEGSTANASRATADVSSTPRGLAFNRMSSGSPATRGHSQRYALTGAAASSASPAAANQAVIPSTQVQNGAIRSSLAGPTGMTFLTRPSTETKQDTSDGATAEKAVPGAYRSAGVTRAAPASIGGNDVSSATSNPGVYDPSSFDRNISMGPTGPVTLSSGASHQATTLRRELDAKLSSLAKELRNAQDESRRARLQIERYENTPGDASMSTEALKHIQVMCRVLNERIALGQDAEQTARVSAETESKTAAFKQKVTCDAFTERAFRDAAQTVANLFVVAPPDLNSAAAGTGGFGTAKGATQGAGSGMQALSGDAASAAVMRKELDAIFKLAQESNRRTSEKTGRLSETGPFSSEQRDDVDRKSREWRDQVSSAYGEDNVAPTDGITYREVIEALLRQNDDDNLPIFGPEKQLRNEIRAMAERESETRRQLEDAKRQLRNTESTLDYLSGSGDEAATIKTLTQNVSKVQERNKNLEEENEKLKSMTVIGASRDGDLPELLARSEKREKELQRSSQLSKEAHAKNEARLRGDVEALMQQLIDNSIEPFADSRSAAIKGQQQDDNDGGNLKNKDGSSVSATGGGNTSGYHLDFRSSSPVPSTIADSMDSARQSVGRPEKVDSVRQRGTSSSGNNVNFENVSGEAPPRRQPSGALQRTGSNLGKLMEQIAELQSENDRLRRDRDDLAARASSAGSNDVDDMLVALHDRIKTLQNHNDSLNSSLRSAESEIRHLEEQNSKLARNDSVIDKYLLVGDRGLTAEEADMSSPRSTLRQTEGDTDEQRLDALHNRIDSLSDINRKLRAVVKNLEAEKKMQADDFRQRLDELRRSQQRAKEATTSDSDLLGPHRRSAGNTRASAAAGAGSFDPEFGQPVESPATSFRKGATASNADAGVGGLEPPRLSPNDARGSQVSRMSSTLSTREDKDYLIRKIQEELGQLQQERTQLRQQLEDKDVDNDLLQKDLDYQRAECNKAKIDLASQIAVTTALVDSPDTVSAIEKLRNELMATKQENADLREEISRLSDMLADAEKRAKDADMRAKQAEKRASNLHDFVTSTASKAPSNANLTVNYNKPSRDASPESTVEETNDTEDLGAAPADFDEEHDIAFSQKAREILDESSAERLKNLEADLQRALQDNRQLRNLLRSQQLQAEQNQTLRSTPGSTMGSMYGDTMANKRTSNMSSSSPQQAGGKGVSSSSASGGDISHAIPDGAVLPYVEFEDNQSTKKYGSSNALSTQHASATGMVQPSAKGSSNALSTQHASATGMVQPSAKGSSNALSTQHASATGMVQPS
eukprot:PhM_4_TR15481/c0_g2_i1/m.56130